MNKLQLKNQLEEIRTDFVKEDYHAVEDYDNVVENIIDYVYKFPEIKTTIDRHIKLTEDAIEKSKDEMELAIEQEDIDQFSDYHHVIVDMLEDGQKYAFTTGIGTYDYYQPVSKHNLNLLISEIEYDLGINPSLEVEY